MFQYLRSKLAGIMTISITSSQLISCIVLRIVSRRSLKNEMLLLIPNLIKDFHVSYRIGDTTDDGFVYRNDSQFYNTNWTDVGIGKTGRVILKAKVPKTVGMIRLQMAETNRFHLSSERLIVKVRDNAKGI